MSNRSGLPPCINPSQIQSHRTPRCITPRTMLWILLCHTGYVTIMYIEFSLICPNNLKFAKRFQYIISSFKVFIICCRLVSAGRDGRTPPPDPPSSYCQCRRIVRIFSTSLSLSVPLRERRELSWRQVLESKTRSPVYYADNKLQMWSLWMTVIVVGMVLVLCRGILMFVVLGLSYVWENRSWWQRRREHHVFSACGASLAGDSLRFFSSQSEESDLSSSFHR